MRPIDRKFGRFFISQKVIEQYGMEMVAARIYDGIFPTRLEYLWDRYGWDVTAWSHHFEPVDEGYELPIYEIELRPVFCCSFYGPEHDSYEPLRFINGERR